MRTPFAIVLMLLAIATAPTSASAQNVSDGAPGGWTGFFAGGHLGGAWGDADGFTNVSSLDLDGAAGGLHGGYNHQIGQIVVGVEGDFSWAGSDGSDAFQNGATFTKFDNELDYLASIRGRLGFALAEFLIYGTAGIGFSDYELTAQATNLVTATTIQSGGSDTLTGFVFGGGVAWKASNIISVRAEVLHYNFNDAQVVLQTNTTRTTANLDPDQTVVRTGLNIHLN